MGMGEVSQGQQQEHPAVPWEFHVGLTNALGGFPGAGCCGCSLCIRTHIVTDPSLEWPLEKDKAWVISVFLLFSMT